MKEFAKTELTEKQVSSRSVFRGHLLDIYDDEVLLPNGQTSRREYNRHVGAVCVVPITAEGNVIMERQYRYPVGQVLLEIPAGKLDAKNEDREEAVRRELREETGAVAGTLVDLGWFYPAAAYSDECITMYLAKDLSYGERALDEDEFLNVEEIPLSELVRAALAGELHDAKTQMAILRAYLYEKGEGR